MRRRPLLACSAVRNADASRAAGVVLTVLLALTGCGAQAPVATGSTDAAKAQDDARAAEQLGRDFDAQFAAGHWELAKANGDLLIAHYPNSAAAHRIAAQHALARSNGEASREKLRLEGQWTYLSEPQRRGRQLSASIYSRDSIATGAGTSRVRLIFRDHPEWGRSSYLVLENGDFNCYGGCTLKVRVDGKQRAMAGSRPKTDEAIAMFVKDEHGLWQAVKKSHELTISIPLKTGGTRDAVFEVGGLDASRMPGW